MSQANLAFSNVSVGPVESPVEAGIKESRELGFLILSPGSGPVRRRVLYINSYGGSALWDKIKGRITPGQHLWGCLELVRAGYEVAVAEPLRHFYFRSNPLPHDLRLLRLVREWLGKDGVVYCGHTLLYWLPLLKRLGFVKNPMVSLTFAREALDLARTHSGILAMTPAAAEKAKKMAPRVKVAHIGWGVDLGYFPKLAYCSDWFLSCGITHRDFGTLSAGLAKGGFPTHVICPGLPKGVEWSSNVVVMDGGASLCIDKTTITYDALLREYYARCSAALIVVKRDDVQDTAVGFTNLLEAMAMGRPVIVTRTGALPGEVDVEREGCGLFVPPENPKALAEAMATVVADPVSANAMGERGRELCEKHYNMTRFGNDLHRFFETL